VIIKDTRLMKSTVF